MEGNTIPLFEDFILGLRIRVTVEAFADTSPVGALGIPLVPGILPRPAAAGILLAGSAAATAGSAGPAGSSGGAGASFSFNARCFFLNAFITGRILLKSSSRFCLRACNAFR